MSRNKNFPSKSCENCGTPLILTIQRDILRKRFCSQSCNGSFTSRQNHKNIPGFTEKHIAALNTPEANRKKSHKGSAHPQWIEDRSKLKQKRGCFEEKKFYAEVLAERAYICELTKEAGGKLAVHHIDSVHLFPEKRFSKNNVIVIKKDIHMDFHKRHGFQWATQSKWSKYLKEEGYVCG